MKTTPKIASTKVDVQTYLSQERSLGPACQKVRLLDYGTVADFRIFKFGWWSSYLEGLYNVIFISDFCLPVRRFHKKYVDFLTRPYAFLEGMVYQFSEANDSNKNCLAGYLPPETEPLV